MSTFYIYGYFSFLFSVGSNEGSITHFQSQNMDGFEIVREIGQGSYGTVWLVKRQRDSKQLVLKTVDLRNASIKEIEAARQEVVLLSRLKHPNIVSYKGSFELENQLHLLMSFCEGGDLQRCIKQQKGKNFTEEKIIRWFIQITMALQYLHQNNILHRDLKTQNIFLTIIGLIKLGDFGVCRVLDNSVDMATTMIGTPYYMSPELFAGVPYNHKSDMWSLGCCLYELVTLKNAFQARDMAALINRISRGKVNIIPSQYSQELQFLLDSLLSRAPSKRPSAHSVLQKKYIRKHIRCFLNDTKSNGKGDDGFLNKSTETESLNDLQSRNKSCVSEKNEESYDNVKYADNHRSNYKPVRCCELLLPTDLDSLQISGGKMRLEDRSKIEIKVSGTKECNCYRNSKVTNIDSQSRQRRRRSKSSYIKESHSEVENSNKTWNRLTFSKGSIERVQRKPSSARERRRQQKSEELTDLNSENIENCLNERLDSSEISNLLGDIQDDDNEDDLMSEYKQNKISEVEEFVEMLDTTLQEEEHQSVDDAIDEVFGDEIKSLEADLVSALGTIKSLEADLVSALGTDLGMDILNQLKTQEWEECRENILDLLTERGQSSLSATIFHLKLCYEFEQ
ncbi:unnamed protein product, partial [Meganyctiphanes norvegica]